MMEDFELRKLKPMLVRVYTYKMGMEDGFRPHPKGHGHPSIPYVNTRSGRRDVNESVRIIEFTGGMKEVWTDAFTEFATQELSIPDLNKLLADNEEHY